MKQIKTLFPYLKNNRNKIYIIILISIFLAFINIFPAKLIEILIDQGLNNQKLNIIFLLSLILFILYLLKSCFSFILNTSFITLGQKTVSKFRQDIYSKVVNFPMEFYTKNDSIYINERIQEVNNITSFFSPQVIQVLVSFLEFIFAIIILSKISLNLLLILIIPVPLLVFFANKMIFNYSKITKELLEESANYSSKINETIKGIEHIKTSATENKEIKKITDYDNNLVFKQSMQMINMKKYMEIITFIMSLIPLIIYVVGGIFLVNNKISLGGIISFTMYISKLYSPFLTIISLSFILNPAFLSLKRLNELFINKNYVINDNTSKEKITNIDSIEFDNLDFSYENGKNTLTNISFSFNKNNVYKICGENGSGKSTLLKLFMNIYTPSKGNIFINNKNINTFDKIELRKNISIVAQKVFLFNDTIKNNIIYGLDDYEEKDYLNVIKQLNLDKFFNTLPLGENTLVGENGIKLSGGELQKISIARAFLKKSNVYLFDEANSNIDYETSLILKNFIKNNKNNNIIIIIEHSDTFDDITDDILNISKKPIMKKI